RRSWQGMDPEAASKVDRKSRRRLVSAIEIHLLSRQKPCSHRTEWTRDVPSSGVFVFRERDELYDRINRRVEAMFENGVIEEARNASAMSETASKMIVLREIRELLAGKMSILQCVAAIQQATRRYA